MRFFADICQRFADARADAFRRNLVYEVQRLRLSPGDIVVLKTKEAISEARAHALRKALTQVLAPDTKSMILADGLELGVVSRASLPPPMPEDTDGILRKGL